MKLFNYLILLLVVFLYVSCTDSSSSLESFTEDDLILLVEEINQRNIDKSNNSSFFTLFTLPKEHNPFLLYKETERVHGTQRADHVFKEHREEKQKHEKIILENLKKKDWSNVCELYELSLKELSDNHYLYAYEQFMQYNISKSMLNYLEQYEKENLVDDEKRCIADFLYSTANSLSQSGFPDMIFMSKIYSRLLDDHTSEEISPMVKKTMVSAKNYFNTHNTSYINPTEPNLKRKVDDFFSKNHSSIQE